MARPGLILLLLTSWYVGSPNAYSPSPRSKALPAASVQQAAVNPLAASMAAFLKRVNAYLDLRNAVAKAYPEVKETGDPSKISTREKALGQAIAKTRQSAKAGDVFGPDMSPHLVRILAEDWESRSPADRRAIFGEVPPGLELKVNQPYPTNLPLVSVPAQLLARLPTLPEALEYRLAERRLLLRDRDANVIVDVLVGVLPKR